MHATSAPQLGSRHPPDIPLLRYGIERLLGLGEIASFMYSYILSGCLSGRSRRAQDATFAKNPIKTQSRSVKEACRMKSEYHHEHRTRKVPKSHYHTARCDRVTPISLRKVILSMPHTRCKVSQVCLFPVLSNLICVWLGRNPPPKCRRSILQGKLLGVKPILKVG